MSDMSSIVTVRGLTLPVHLYTRGYSLFSLMRFSSIHLDGFAKRSPNLCIVVSMELLLSECQRGDALVIHRCMLNKLLVIKFS